MPMPMGASVWTPDGLRQHLAETYYAAACVGADMRSVADRLERLRELLAASEQPYDAWELLDDSVGDAYGRPELPAIIELRDRYRKELGEAALAAILDAGAEAWPALVAGVAAAVLANRFALADELVAAPIAIAGREADRRVLREGVRCALYDQWAATYPAFRLLAEQSFLSTDQRARFVAAQGQLEMYHLFRNDRAKALIGQALEMSPDDPHVATSQGEYFLNRNEIASARTWFERALAARPRLAWAAYLLGDCALRENDPASAEAWYRDALKRRPGETGAYIRLCRLEAKRAGPPSEDPIPELVQRATVVYPLGQYSFFIEAGAAYQESGRFDVAHEWYQRAVALDASRVGSYAAEGYLFLEQEQMVEARKAFQHAVDVAPEALEGFWGMARVAEQTLEWRDAERWYEDALPRRPEWEALIRATIARVQCRQEKSAEAERSALEAIRLAPDDETVLAVVEGVAEDIGRTHRDVERARQLFDGVRAVLGEPYEARYRNQIGNLFVTAGDHESAVGAFAAAVAADPAKALYRTSLGRVLRQLRAWDRSRALWDTAPPEVRSDSAFRSEMALLRNAEANELFVKRQYAKAIPLYEEAITYSPADPVLYSNLARAWESDRLDPDERRLDAAETALKEAARLAPESRDYADRLAQIDRLRALLPSFGDVRLDWLPFVTPIVIEVAPDLVPLVEGDAEGGLTPEFLQLITDARARIRQKYGLVVPGVRVRGNAGDAPPGSYIIMLGEVPVVMGSIARNKRFCPASVAQLRESGVDAELASDPPGNAGAWVSRENWGHALEKGHVLWAVIEYAVRHIELVVERNLADFVGVQEAFFLLESSAPDRLDAVRGSPGGLPRFAAVLRGLVSERVPLGKIPALCDGFLALDRHGTSPADIVEQLRASEDLKPLLPGNAPPTRLLAMDPAFEERIVRAIHSDEASAVLAISAEECQEALSELRSRLDVARDVALIVENARIRPFLRKMMEVEWPELPVLARRELVMDPSALGGVTAPGSLGAQYGQPAAGASGAAQEGAGGATA